MIDCRKFVGTDFHSDGLSLEHALETAMLPGQWVWVDLRDPDSAAIEEIRTEFRLHRLAIEDALRPHQRPKLDTFEETVFVVLKPARYDDETDEVTTQELHVFVGSGFIITIRHGTLEEVDAARARLQVQNWSGNGDSGPAAALYALCDTVIDGYPPIVDAIEIDIDEIEAAVFSEERHRANQAARIFDLKRQVLELARNVAPFGDALYRLARGDVALAGGEHETLAPYFRDVEDHLYRVVGRIESCRELLSAALEANLAQISVRQNDDMRTISAWAAVIAVPTMLAGIWGMNFEHMPELGHRLGYPFALGTIFGTSGLIWLRLKRAGWL